MPRLVVEFTKMNGAGNDFIVIDNRFYNLTDGELSGIARRFCPRRTGIGADGVLALNEPVGDADFRMRYINADGSNGTMCGNGARCLAYFARMAAIAGEPLRFETDAGIHTARVDLAQSVVRLEMVRPRDYAESVNVAPGLPTTGYIWTGTEHAVVQVESAGGADVHTLGPALRNDRVFAEAGANVNFVERLDGSSLRVRTFEKGVEAETLACGTGAVASAAVAVLAGLVSGPAIDVEMPGGRLQVVIERDADGAINGVELTGPVQVAFRGTFEL